MKRIYSNYFMGLLGAFLLLSLGLNPVWAQRRNKQSTNTNTTYQEDYYKSLQWRNVGPFRGGRSASVAGVPGKPHLYYMGATGGGVWRTNDAGSSWENISDGYFGGSIGAVAVSEADPNVIYVGGGEVTVRGNVSHGDGVWKSLDAGKTWSFMGLKDTRHIPRIRIHPKNPNLVYVAAMGHLFGPNQERGVFRSKDGGKTWENILYVNEQAGAVDLVLDPNNPRIMYASTWRILRTPYSLESGGEGSALWKSTDGGDTWEKLNDKAEGLPQGTWGISGVTVSPVNSNRVWAIIEAKAGGVYRSDDAGKTWKKINDERKLRQRAWYYTRIYADTQNEDVVYVLNVQFHKSKDGGKTYESISTPHGDHHDMWINPDNANYYAVADDGGAQITMNNGESFSTYYNQPTAQFYRVVTDNHFPYRLYGGQQDNSTVRIASRTDRGGITERDWEPTAGGESAHIAPHPKNPDIVYGGSYDGFLVRIDHETGNSRSVDVYPDNPMGWGAKDLKYRFQWNFPIFFSRHDPNTLYTAANVLFKSTNEGQSWEAISPDLTRNDSTKLGPSGGAITKDNTSVEYYCTIFAADESPVEKGVLWVGSDDGLVHVTRDGGQNWENVTPPNMPEWTMINCVEPHPTQKGACYIAGTRYKLDDFKPYLYKTTDYGKTWTAINTGIDPMHFTRAIRVDPVKPEILYAGTEYGVYISFNNGGNWQALQLNLPQVPITDLAVKENDLIAATQGRSYWILDDLSMLHQVGPELANKSMHLFKPEPVYNRMGGSRTNTKFNGQNPPGGVAVHFYLKDMNDSSKVSLEFMDKAGKLIRKFSSVNDKNADPVNNPVGKLKAKTGANRFIWNMRYPDATKFKGMILWAGGTTGPKITPGTYQVKLTVDGNSQTQEFDVVKDPRIESSDADLKAQQDFLLSVHEKLSETHEGIIQIRQVRSQIKGFTDRLPKENAEQYEDIRNTAKEINKKLSKIEEALYQTKNRSRQDPLNFPIRLNNKLSALSRYASNGFYPPTEQMKEVKKDLVQQIDNHLGQLKQVIQNDVPKFNRLVSQKSIPAIYIDQTEQ